eukprot:NODE_387_length_1557_cov_67.818302_g280_i0.p6 GENE.NODE_387_length_1557_cov_67.818302_g280_i0~~NODE_387_length_1557_cov_67.818302_g280_i0.p6  ORF type:complete len:81 (+),score=2.33 NODE_387_length_1557_cov_67.818302_g280_i0:769-1011(+)
MGDAARACTRRPPLGSQASHQISRGIGAHAAGLQRKELVLAVMGAGKGDQEVGSLPGGRDASACSPRGCSPCLAERPAQE